MNTIKRPVRIFRSKRGLFYYGRKNGKRVRILIQGSRGPKRAFKRRAPVSSIKVSETTATQLNTIPPAKLINAPSPQLNELFAKLGIQTRENQIAEQQKQTAEAQENFLKQQLEEVAKQVQAREQRISELQQSIGPLEAQISEMTQQIKLLDAEAADYQTNVDMLNGEIARKQQELNMANDEILKLQSETEALTQESQTQKDELAKTRVELNLAELEKLKQFEELTITQRLDKNDSGPILKYIPKDIITEARNTYEKDRRKSGYDPSPTEITNEALKKLGVLTYDRKAQKYVIVKDVLAQFDPIIKRLYIPARNSQTGTGLSPEMLKDALTFDQIDHIMRRLIERNGWDCYYVSGAYDTIHTREFMSEITDYKPIVMILGTGEHYEAYTHYVAIYLDWFADFSVEYFDSFGMGPPTKIMARINGILRDLSPDVYLKMKFSTVVNQMRDWSNCGYLAMLFLINRLNGATFADASGYTSYVENNTAQSLKDAEAFKRKLQRFKYV